MSPIRVAVIVLNYRGESVLHRCLESLEKAIGPEDRILVVDNGHEDALMRSVKTRFRGVECLTSETNQGFAAGMNLGIQAAQKQNRFDAYWLMNNDASVAPQTLIELKRALQAKGSQALFSPVIFSGPGGSPWYAGGHIDFLRMRATHKKGLPSNQTPYETGFLTGCALFIPAAALARIGLLDERYFLYYEDVAYSLRAQRLGLKLWVVPAAPAFHSEESQTNPTKIYWLVRSGAEFFLRESRGGWWLWVRIYFSLRRLKNWLQNRCCPQPLATEIKRAYTDVSL